MISMEFIVASCKEWHREGFQQLSTSLAHHKWLWISNPEELNEVLKDIKPRYIFFLHWNWLVPESIWSELECICFHMTDVPYGRGGSPLQNLIEAGKSETIMTALRMVREMDAGPVYKKLPLSLSGRAEDIYIRAGFLCYDLIRWVIDVQPEPVEQSGEVTIFKRRTPDQSVLPVTGELVDLFDHIRMLDAPTYPMAFIDYGAFRIEFSDAEIEGDNIKAEVIIRRQS
tara:strand:- start:22561 stop:23244 length:684 start_codon:yes stop_codon:yes gene_type:complete